MDATNNNKETFLYWYRRSKEDMNTFEVYDTTINEYLGAIDEESHETTVEQGVADEVVRQFVDKFSARPEYLLGHPITILHELTLEELKDTYLKLIQAVLLVKLEDDQKAADRMKMIQNWLECTDFFTAPASSRYHDSNVGGLVYHSLTVYNRIMELKYTNKFESVPVESAALVALVHDWCKIGYYECYQKNVKNEQTGQWEKVSAYKVNQTGIPLGHGVSSMFLANRCIILNPEEACAIRWHMGEYNVANNEMNELHKANHSHPLCYLIQFADRLACVDY